MRDPVAFKVFGIPVAQGSKKMVGPYRMVDTAKGLGDWRNQVADAAHRLVLDGVEPFDGPLKLSGTFRFPMPKSRKKSTREFGYAFKTTTPDLDKLVRTVGDALTVSGLIADDARIAHLDVGKLEVWDRWTGVHLEIGPLDW